MKLRSLLASMFYLSRFLLSLLLLWVTLSWRVRKARVAFERQLVLQGMSKRDAKRLSAFYKEVKDELFNVLRTGLS